MPPNDPDTGRAEGDAVGRHANDGKDQNDYTHSDDASLGPGQSKQTTGGPGTAGSHPQAGPGAPQPTK